MRHHARHNVKVIQVSQDFESIARKRRKTAAFEEWRKRLNRKDRLPRGPFFRGKTAGQSKHIFVDEFWHAFTPLHAIAS